MKGLNGRDLNQFIKVAKNNTRTSKSKAEALKLSAVELSRNSNNARPKDPPKKSWWGRTFDAGVGMGEYVIKQVISSSINRAIWGTTSGPGTSSQPRSGSPSSGAPRATGSSELEGLMERMRQRRGEG